MMRSLQQVVLIVCVVVNVGAFQTSIDSTRHSRLYLPIVLPRVTVERSRNNISSKSPTILYPLFADAGDSSDEQPFTGEGETNSDPSNVEKKEELLVVPEETKRLNIFQRTMRYFRGNTEEDGLTFRQRLAKMGLSVVLSYGWVSNMSYCVSISSAWYLFSKQTGLSPLAPGQWKKFLAVYAGFYVFNNIVRPIRLAASVAVSPRFDDLVLWVQNRFGVRKGIAVTITVIVVNVFGTIFVSAALIGLASALAGVPVFPAKALTK